MFVTKKQLETYIQRALRYIFYQPKEAAMWARRALKDGYFSELAAAATERFHNSDQWHRAVCAYGTLLMNGNHLDAAEKAFRDYIAAQGEHPDVLVNLAEVYSAQKDTQKAMEALWRVLKINPNGTREVQWYEKMHSEKGGEEAGRDALRRVAALPGSWRAKLWLAKHALQKRQLDEALALYKECLARVAKPYPPELLLDVSGDLGNAGHLLEMLQLVEPHFDERRHGMQVANNLLKAHLDLGQIVAARRMLDRLCLGKGPYWNHCGGLSYWEREIYKAEIGACGPIDPSTVKMVVLSAEGPVWLGPMAAELFPAKSTDALVIGFLGSSTEPGNNSKRLEFTLSDSRKVMSRALPLFFAEQIEFHSRARVKILQPWYCVPNEDSAVVAATTPWSDEYAADLSRLGETKSDYVVISHLKTQVKPWTVELRLVRTIDSKSLGNLSSLFPFYGRQEEMPELAQRLLELLVEQAEVERQPAPPFYEVPKGMGFSGYLRKLEYLLALRCRGLKSIRPGFLCGVRGVIDALIERCGSEPQNVCARLLLAETLLCVKLTQPHVPAEFQGGIEKLQKQKPLTEPAHGVVQRMIDKAFAR